MTLAHSVLAVVASGLAGVVAAQPAPTASASNAPRLDPIATARTEVGRSLADVRRYGVPASPRTAERTIEIDGATRGINVQQDETVLLRNGEKAFAWTFATWSIGSFDLAQILPPGFLPGTDLRVYVAPNPARDGGR